jgi:hypothetical protein
VEQRDNEEIKKNVLLMATLHGSKTNTRDKVLEWQTPISPDPIGPSRRVVA